MDSLFKKEFKKLKNLKKLAIHMRFRLLLKPKIKIDLTGL